MSIAKNNVDTLRAQPAINQTLNGREINVFSYMSDAQIASVKAYNYSIDVTAAVQSALDAAWISRQDVFCPAGGYKIDAASLILPGNRPTVDERDRCLRLYGQGYGNPFSSINTGGTVFKSVSNRPILTDRDISPLPDAQGTFTIDHIRFDGNSTTPVVHLNTFYGHGEFHHNVIYQRSTGDGFKLDYAATVSIHDCYAYNVDFATFVKGASRTGVGFNIVVEYGAGLITLTKCSSRGWKDAYIVDAIIGQTTFHTDIVSCEASVVYNGFTLGSRTSNCSVRECYAEGMDQGTAIIDAGLFNSIVHNQIFAGFTIGIDLQAGSGYGGNCSWNEISSAARPNVTMINVVGNTGLGRSVTDNTIVWGNSGGSIIGVVGIALSGLNPQINLSGNMFNPKINWVGGAGTAQIVDSSTSGFSAGTGQYGLSTASFDNLQIPVLSQGAISLAKPATAITAVSSGVATLSAASSHLITFAAPTNITSFSSGLMEGKFFVVRVTNGNCTFVNGTSLKMAGGINYTPGANGASVTFLVHSNVAWEVGRVAY